MGLKQPALLSSREEIRTGDVLGDRPSGGLFEEITEDNKVGQKQREPSNAGVDPDLEIMWEAQDRIVC